MAYLKIQRVNMETYFNYHLIICFLSSSIILGSSCKKFVEVDPPKSQLTTATVFNNDSTAIAAMRAIYITMINGAGAGFASGYNNSVSHLGALSSDELTSYNISDIPQQEFYQNAIRANNSYCADIWSKCYQFIYAANAIIENLNTSSGVSSSVKNNLIGEGKFIRAFCHFYLVNLFGDVPLVLNTDYRSNNSISRTSKSDVYNQIISDLKDAEGILPADYSSFKGERIRPIKWAASALLARIYLYTNNWANAEQEATSVINNNALYSLNSDLNQIFLKNSNEAIWQLKQVTPGINSWEATNYLLYSAPTTDGYNSSTLSPSLMKAFEFNDKRKTAWVGVFINGTDTFYYPYKYKTDFSTNVTEYSMVLRLAEMFLIRAEARAQANNILGAQADLNMIRSRANLGSTAANDKPSLLNAIMQEREVELFTEWGHRWLDLKRTGLVDAVMGIVTKQKGGTWNTNWQLYPIPQAQIQNDPILAGKQNQGY